MFKGFGYIALVVFVLVGSQIGTVGPGYSILFISLLFIAAGVLAFALLQLPGNLDGDKIKNLLEQNKKDLKLTLTEITELAQVIRRDGLLVAEAHRKTLKDKQLQYLVKRAIEGFEKPQLLHWIENQSGFYTQQFAVLQVYFDRVLQMIPVVGLMGSVCQLMRPAITLESAFVPFLLSLFLQLLIQSLYQEKISQAKRVTDTYYLLLKEGISGIKDGVTSEFIQEQLAARLGNHP